MGIVDICEGLGERVLVVLRFWNLAAIGEVNVDE